VKNERRWVGTKKKMKRKKIVEVEGVRQSAEGRRRKKEKKIE